jgi:Na+-translocating ferredoxin:NAD+ oxidoreductase RnfA subunit
MTRTVGAAVGFLLIVLFFAGVAIEKARADSPRPTTTVAAR